MTTTAYGFQHQSLKRNRGNDAMMMMMTAAAATTTTVPPYSSSFDNHHQNNSSSNNNNIDEGWGGMMDMDNNSDSANDIPSRVYKKQRIDMGSPPVVSPGTITGGATTTTTTSAAINSENNCMVLCDTLMG